MEALCFSKALAHLYWTVCHYISEGDNLKSVTDKTAMDTHNVKTKKFLL
jgi:uncharacterized membrane protein